jgi:hypothetical protein
MCKRCEVLQLRPLALLTAAIALGKCLFTLVCRQFFSFILANQAASDAFPSPITHGPN